MYDFKEYGTTIAETMRNLFNYLSKKYVATTEGCQKIVDKWREKADVLDELFKDIPGFNKEQHCIVLNNKLIRSIKPDVITKFFANFVYDESVSNCRKRATVDGKSSDEWYDIYRYYRDIINALQNLPAEYINYHAVANAKVMKKKAHELYNDLPTYTNESIIEYNKRCEVYKKLKYYYEQLVNDELAKFLNERYPDLRVRIGQKTSKVTRRWLVQIGTNKNQDFEREYAKYADAINPLELDEIYIISWNILDFLTMSFGPSWTSCHSIDKANLHEYEGHAATYRGCYSSGILSYALDKVSIITYTINKSDNDGKTPYWNLPKIHRQMFHINENGSLVLQGRLYPDDQTDCGNSVGSEMYQQYREIVQHVVAQAYKIPNLWTVKKGTSECSCVTISKGTNYPDYTHYSNCNISVNESTNAEQQITLCIGHMPICPSCGNEHSSSDWCTCNNCRPKERCAKCGREIINDDEYFINGKYYCDRCVRYCEYHQEYEPCDVCDQYVIDYGDMCKEGLHALIEKEVVFKCAQCGDYFYSLSPLGNEDDDGEIKYFCSYDCRNAYY